MLLQRLLRRRSRDGKPHRQRGRKREANGYAVYQGTVLSGDEMPKYVGDGALKVVCFSPDREKMRASRSAAERIPGVEINSSWWDNLEIMAAGVHKGAALRCLAQRLEIPLDEVMAIGDNENDLPMLQVAGLPWPWATRWRA